MAEYGTPYISELRDRINHLIQGGLSMREIARRAGVGVGTIFDVKAGRVATVNVETYSKIMGVVANART